MVTTLAAILVLTAILSPAASAAVARFNPSEGSFIFNPGGATQVLGAIQVTFIPASWLPVLKLHLNLTDTSIEYRYELAGCTGVCNDNYTVKVGVERRLAGILVTYEATSTGSRLVYKLYVLPWTLASGRIVHEAIEYRLVLESAEGVATPLSGQKLLVEYSLDLVSSYGVETRPPSIEYTLVAGKPALKLWARMDLLENPPQQVLWPIRLNYTSLLSIPRSVRYVVNGTHSWLELTMPEVRDFVIKVGYASSDYVEARLVCLYSMQTCTDECSRYYAVIEVYNASDGRYLGVAGVTRQCPDRYIVYVRVPYDLVLRFVVFEDGEPVYEAHVLVPKPIVYSSRLKLLLAAIIVGGVVTGVFRRSLKDAAASMIAGAIILYATAPYIGAAEYQPLYIFLAVAGFVTLVVALARGG